MNERELFDALIRATKVEEVRAALVTFRKSPAVDELPFGGRANNRGAIEVATDAARSAIERVTNAHDAILEFEYERHNGKPDCRSPREAASAWLGVPEKDGLSGLSPKQRQDLAAHTVVRLEPGEGWQSRILSVIDQGIGIAQESMESTILSLNESNKIQKHYLAGTYGQGGSSTFAFSKYVLIASRATDSDDIAFTVVRYQDLPAAEYKTGRYVYLVEDGKLPSVKAQDGDIKHGTLVRHYGYDLTSYPFSIGPKSVYGALQRVLFAPVAPIRFENQVHNWNRTIKGSRNALNGAVDQGDDSSRGPDLDYHLPIFSLSLGDHGTIGIEYWVLKRPDKEKNKNPANAFVDSTKPIILSHNGQNQGEMSAMLLKRDADLPFLRNRLIIHVNCDRLSPGAKRLLFSSTREQSREGFVQNTIQSELVSLLKSDDELKRLNEEAREQSLKDKDEAAEKQMQRQVARLLRIVGPALVEVGGTKTEGKGDGSVKQPGGGGHGKPEPIEPKEPPTFIRIVGDEDEEIKFFVGQRKYIRVETDANSYYHDPDDPKSSRINVAVGDNLRVFGTSPLRGGRMRIGVECKTDVAVGTKGGIRVELYRHGLTTLSDERDYRIVEPPKPKEDDRKTAFPQFKVIPVDGPADEDWQYVCDYTDETDVKRHASGAEMSDGVLYVYYSTVYPRFAAEKKRLEQQNLVLAQSFQKRYELWLAVHALLMYQDQEMAQDVAADEDAAKDFERQERCRLASVAAMVATQEVKSGVNSEDAEDAV